MQYGDSDNEGAVKPVRDIDVLDATFGDRAEKYDGVGNPDDGEQKIDRPLEFGIFF